MRARGDKRAVMPALALRGRCAAPQDEGFLWFAVQVSPEPHGEARSGGSLEPRGGRAGAKRKRVIPAPKILPHTPLIPVTHAAPTQGRTGRPGRGAPLYAGRSSAAGPAITVPPESGPVENPCFRDERPVARFFERSFVGHWPFVTVYPIAIRRGGILARPTPGSPPACHPARQIPEIWLPSPAGPCGR